MDCFNLGSAPDPGPKIKPLTLAYNLIEGARCLIDWERIGETFTNRYKLEFVRPHQKQSFP